MWQVGVVYEPLAESLYTGVRGGSVAAGRWHGYAAMGLKLWDVAPASVILQAAGGVITNGLGASWLHSEDGSVIASNATLHGRLITSSGPLNALRRTATAPVPREAS